MTRKTGITQKTFLFVALLIVSVTFVSFTILYFAMPPYYSYKKVHNLKSAIVSLREDLVSTVDSESCAAIIYEFTEKYNATVVALDPKGNMILQLSTPFVSLNYQEEMGGQFFVNLEQYGEDTYLSIMTDLYQTAQQEIDQAEEGVVELESYVVYASDLGNGLFFEEEIQTTLISRIQIQGTLQPIGEARGVILSLIPYVLAAGCAIGAVLAWFYVKQLTRPILKLSATAARMQNMEPDVMSGIRTRDELGLLSENMDALYRTLIETIGDLKNQMEKVNRLEQSKTAMMQSASHELKTPVAALSGMLDGMIDNVGVYKEKDKYLIKCKDQVDKLSFLVQEILEASRTDSGIHKERQADIEVDVMVAHILKEHEYQIREKKLQVHADLDSVVFHTDAQTLYGAIVNLLGNAVLYTPEQGIITISLRADYLEIENETEPIPEAELDKLFEPFYTRSDSRDKSVSGTGLGLYIVKRNLEQLSIAYRVENTASGFKVTLTLY
ncbi:MAG: ATP-binding protein [Lachnospiraceae bacterium]